MENAISLLFFTPILFVQASFALFNGEWIAWIPALGIAGLILGTSIGIRRRRRSLLIFVVPLLMSQFLVILAGAFPGDIQVDLTLPVIIVFLAIQLGFAGYAIYRAVGARSAAVGLTVFTVSFALTAIVSASMFSVPLPEGAAAPALFRP